MRDMSKIRTALFWAFLLFAVGIGAGWVSTGPLEQLMLNQIEGIRQVSQQLEQGGNVQWNFFLFIFLTTPSRVYWSFTQAFSSASYPLYFCLLTGWCWDLSFMQR